MIKILVVDDDPLTLKLCEALCKALLQALGEKFEITLSSDPIDAFKKIVHAPFDLIITDIMMPKLNGNTLLRAARDLPHFQTPILMISGKKDEKTVHNALALGANDFVSKPIQSDLFIEKINHWLAPAI